MPGAEVAEFRVEASYVWAAGSGKGGEHCGTGIDGVNSNGGTRTQEAGREATVTIAEDEGVAAVDHARQKGGSASPEKRPEAEPFHPTVGAGKAVEVGYSIGQAARFWL